VKERKKTEVDDWKTEEHYGQNDWWTGLWNDRV